jgi:hypothetical protein
MKKIDVEQLAKVTGGEGKAFTIADVPDVPKYSAAWWDFVRAGGSRRWYK